MSNAIATAKSVPAELFRDANGSQYASYQVICICGGCGFPLTASAARIINIGKALQAAGFGFRLLHCGPSPVPLNTQKSGVYQGI